VSEPVRLVRALLTFARDSTPRELKLAAREIRALALDSGEVAMLENLAVELNACADRKTD
jgi:hypothetical protein